MTRRTHALFAVLAAVAGSCDLEAPWDRGERLFASATVRGVSGAYAPYSCAFCHDTGAPPPDGTILPGHSLKNAMRRPSYWGGQKDNLRDAADLCVQAYLGGPGLLDSDWTALERYLDHLSDPGPAPASPMTLPDASCLNNQYKNPPEPVCPTPGCDLCAPAGDGDPGRGATVYRRTCQHCHGALEGAGKALPWAPVLGRGRSGAFQLGGTKSEDDPDNNIHHLVGKIRFGNFFTYGLPGAAAAAATTASLPPGTLAHLAAFPNMPPFSHERLPDADLIDLLAFLYGAGQ